MTPAQSTTLRCPNCQYDVSQTLRDNIATCPECGSAIGYDKLPKTHPFFPVATRTRSIIAWLLLPSLLYGVAITFPAYFDRAVLQASTHPIRMVIQFIVLSTLCLGTPILLASYCMWTVNLYHAMVIRHGQVNPWMFTGAVLGGLTLSFSLVLIMFNIW